MRDRSRLAAALICMAVLAAPALAETPALRATGNEPGWRADVGQGALVLRRLGMDDLSLPITARDKIDGADVITARDADLALRATLRLTDAVCRDTMTGMPFPMRAELSMGDSVLTGCAGDPADLLTGAEWRVETLGDAAPLADAAVTLAFDADGRVSGSTGCNRFHGAYELTGETLTFGPAATTMMACPDTTMAQERQVLDTLAAIRGFDIGDSGALILRDAEGPAMIARRP